MSGTLVFSLIYIKIVQVKVDQTEWEMKVDIIKKTASFFLIDLMSKRKFTFYLKNGLLNAKY